MENEMDELSALVNSPTEPEDIKPDLITIKPATDWMKDAASRPDSRPLWQPFWNEGELACLFADSNLGKSIYAVQIAADIARNTKVIYFDFELADKQFQLRYTDNATGAMYVFPKNFLRGEINTGVYIGDNFEDAIIDEIERQALVIGSKVIIVDNLTWICNSSDKGDAAGLLMQNLMLLKKKYDWSILVIAHTPKRSLFSAITQNDLAGSKKLFNFFDCVFAIRAQC